ncbi:MAG: flagellar filament capping protein FliD [Desulfocapsaceae bacterium]|nr:flagellar filament capping protein FliD [Desulfocapsaceae bacterium]
MSTTTSSVSTSSAPITFSGLASGLDTNSIVTKLMAVNQQPITNLQNKETAQTNTLKAYGEVNTLLTTLQSSVAAMDLTSEVRTTTANVSSGSPFTATSANAFTGSYNITVSQLAQVQKNISSGFSSETDGVLGTGSISIGGQTITVSSANDSLQGLMSAINADSGSTGVTASIINDGSTTNPYHIILTGQDASKTFTVSSSLQDSSGNAISFSTNRVQTAQQADLTIDGVAVVSNSNTVTGAIAGVTLNLNAVSSVSQQTQVQQDTSPGFSSYTDSILGTGTVTVGSQTINVTSSNNSLEGLMSSINAVSGTTGITASISNDGGSSSAPYHIVLTSQSSSTPFTVSSSLQDSSNNNVTFMSSTSSSGTEPQYATSQLSITPDTTALEKNINTFVTNYNAVINWVNAGYTQISNTPGSPASDPSTAASPTDTQLSQILIGDPTLNGIVNQLQTILSGSVSSSNATGTLNNLSAIGISTNQDGTLSVNTSTLENVLSTNFSGVTTLLAGDGTTSSTGVMGQFNTYLLSKTDPTLGMYAEKKTAEESTMSDLDNQIATKQAALTEQEATMKARFTAMELMISNLNSQSGYIASLDSLAGISSASSGSSSTSSSSSSSSSS